MSGITKARMAESGLYAHTTAYSLVLGAIIVLVPLYILSLGYSPAGLGLIIAGQGVFQVGLRLFGGILSDRLGERWVMQCALAAMACGSFALAFSESVFWMIIAQALFGGSRSIYWVAAQSYGTRTDEDRPAAIMGRFFGFGSAGSIIGNGGAAVVAATFGFETGFILVAIISIASMIVVAITPKIPNPSQRTLKEILSPVPKVFLKKAIVLPAILAFGTSLQMGVMGSIGAALFEEFGFLDKDAAITFGMIAMDKYGFLMSTHAIGSVIAGFTFAKFITKAGQQITYALTMGGNGVLLLSIVFIGDIFLIATLMMFTLGLAFNSGRVFNSSLTAMASLPEQRGVFMAVVGIYWALGVFIGPFVFGPLAELTSLSISISVVGILMLIAAVMTPVLFRITIPTKNSVD